MADKPSPPNPLSRNHDFLKKVGEGMRQRLEPVAPNPQPTDITDLVEKLRAAEISN